MAEAHSVGETVEAYLRAINERDQASRAKLLEAAVTDDFVFTGVVRQTESREAFDQLVGEILSASPEEDGETITRTTEVDAHHGWVHFRWALRNAQGVVTTPEGEQMVGWYVGQLAPDGRLERIVVFVGSGDEGEAAASEEESSEQSGEQAWGVQEAGIATTSSEEPQQQRSATTLGDLTARRQYGPEDQG